mmetsp:Transcript_26431/g.59170  ORF Transcript_26431/g.59170 Transcript_26431/m.59170 type:complete len:202 (-) Transcript_26431:782-1387(-)
MVLVGHLVFVGPEAAAAPHVVLLEQRQRLGKCGVAHEVGGRVPVLETAVVDGHDLRVRLAKCHVDRPLDGFLDDFRQVDGLLHALAHLEHEGPVGPRRGLARLGGRPIRQAQSREELSVRGGVGLGVVAKDGAAVEGAVVLGVVEPALEVVRVDAPEADADNVRGRVVELVRQVTPPHHAQGQVERNGRHELLVLDFLPVL